MSKTRVDKLAEEKSQHKLYSAYVGFCDAYSVPLHARLSYEQYIIRMKELSEVK